MTAMRTTLAVLLALWLALPSLGSEGGGDAGGTGVWILPTAAPMHGALLNPTQPRCAGSVRSQTGLTLSMSSQVGPAAAVFVSASTSDTMPLSVHGGQVVLPQSLLQYLASSGGRGMIVVTDANQFGYVVDVRAKKVPGEAGLKVRLSVF